MNSILIIFYLILFVYKMIFINRKAHFIGDDIGHHLFYINIKSKKLFFEDFYLGDSTDNKFTYHIFFHKVVNYFNTPIWFLKYLNTILYFLFSFIVVYFYSEYFLRFEILFYFLIPFFLWSPNNNSHSFFTYSERYLVVILANLLIILNYLYFVQSKHSFLVIGLIVLISILIVKISMFGIQFISLTILPLVVICSFYYSSYLLISTFLAFIPVFYLVFILNKYEFQGYWDHLITFNKFYGIKKFLIFNRLKDLILVADILIFILFIFLSNNFDFFYFTLLFINIVINSLVITKPFYRFGEGYRYFLFSFFLLNIIYIQNSQLYFLILIQALNLIMTIRKYVSFTNDHNVLLKICKELKTNDIIAAFKHRVAEVIYLYNLLYFHTPGIKVNSFRFYRKNNSLLKYYPGTFPLINLDSNFIAIHKPTILILQAKYDLDKYESLKFKKVLYFGRYKLLFLNK